MSLVTVLIAVRRNGISILWEDDMKKIYLWLKKHLNVGMKVMTIIIHLMLNTSFVEDVDI